jgi:hypothetical protein
VVVVSGPNDKVRLPRDEIASIASSNVSLMPDGFATQLTQRELTDLFTTWKVMANHCQITGSFESQINQAFFNTKGQRVKGSKKVNQIKPLSLCPFDPLC